MPIKLPLPLPITAIPQEHLASAFVHDGKLSLARILDTRKSHQASTGVHSQRTTLLDPKFAKAVSMVQPKIKATGNKPKVMSVREASHRVRIAQEVDPELRKPKTNRELNWQNTSRRVMLILLTSRLTIVCTKVLVLTSMHLEISSLTLRRRTSMLCTVFAKAILWLCGMSPRMVAGSTSAKSSTSTRKVRANDTIQLMLPLQQWGFHIYRYAYFCL